MSIFLLLKVFILCYICNYTWLFFLHLVYIVSLHQFFNLIDFPYFINCYLFLYYSFLLFSLGLLSGFFSSISSSGSSISSFLIQSRETYTTPFCHRMGILFTYLSCMHSWVSIFPCSFSHESLIHFFKCLFLVVLETVSPGVIIDLYLSPVSLADGRC